MTTLDIHNVTRIYVLNELKPRQPFETARRTILILTENGKINEIAILDPNQIKSIFNSGEFSESPSILKSVAGRHAEEAFYSAVVRAVEDTQQKKFSKDQAKALFYTEKNGNRNMRPGVKAEEVDWMGLPEFLETKDSFTKDEILEFVRQNQVEIREVVKDNTEPNLQAFLADYELEIKILKKKDYHS